MRPGPRGRHPPHGALGNTGEFCRIYGELDVNDGRGTPVFARPRKRKMSHPMDVAFLGEPDYRDSPLQDAISKVNRRRTCACGTAGRWPATRHYSRPPRTPFPRSPEGGWRRYQVPYAGPGVWG